ncbi:uncharacterized protein LOC126555886 [Aphis gossypii]|uniref:uncharacterized protein LOC126555886 n=1 Tax=Aphis gossypii TaxID=80765 RepID=UPI002158DBB2|nr:uncharacterized protein LOC126555886 [Aphis gossypii]
MPRRCSVDQCHILKNNIKSTLFKAPKDPSILTAWNQAVSKANGKSSIAHYVCKNHFSAEDLISVYTNYPGDLNTNEVAQRKICSLKKGAIPSIFNSLFECHSQNETFNDSELITINKLNTELNNIHKRTREMSDSAVSNVLNKLSESQKTIINEIISTSKVHNPKSRRYSEDWILLCILLKIRSPSTYTFLREQDILPLPCTRTVRKYLFLIKTKCGFDEKFFQLLKKKLAMLSPQQRHGMLIYDEIILRESIDVDSKSLTYIGLEDFGEDMESTGLKANHALVFMFQSLCTNFSQPIAVFASRGPTKGLFVCSNQILRYT